MPELCVKIQDLEDGDRIVPSGRIVESVTIDAHTPIGHRVVRLRSGDDVHSASLPADKLVTVQRNWCLTDNPIWV